MKAYYSSTRLLFKKDIIEKLGWDESFQVYVSNDNCKYEMTKRQFYDVFDNVVKTVSYKEHGVYHYHPTPSKAYQFIIV